MALRILKNIGKKNVALFVDGPNIIRKEFRVNLDELRQKTMKYGRIKTGKVFLNQFASRKLIEAVANQGLEPTVVFAGEGSEERGEYVATEHSDVDVPMAVAAVEASMRKDIDVITIASRDADFLSVVQCAKNRGKTVVVIGTKPGFSAALQKAADYVEVLETRNG